MASQTRRAGRFARIAGIVLASILAIVVLVVALTGLLPVGGQLVAGLVSSLASNEERSVTISPPSGLLTGRLRIETITVGDRDGTYAEIRDLAVDWSPLSLVRGAFRASLVSAESISLSRRPLPSETTSESTGFSLPLAIEIERVSVPDIAIAEAVLGQPFALALTGAVDANNESAGLTLDIASRTQQDARASANIVYAPAENRLTLEASVAEPEGGMLARLANLPGTPSVALDLTGEGPLSDWSGRLTGTVAGEQVLALEGRHRLTDEGNAVTVSGGGTPSELLPPVFRPLFAGETRIDIAALLKSDGGLRIDTGHIENESFGLNAAGTYDPAGGANDLQAALTGVNGPIDFRWPLENGEVRALIRDFGFSLSGPSDAARLSVTANVDSTALPPGSLSDLRFTATGENLDLASRTGRILAELTAGGSTFSDENLQRLVRAPIRLNVPLALAGDAIAIESAGLESASIGGSLTGSYALSAQDFTGDFRLFALPGVLPPGMAEKLSTTIAAEGRIAAGNGSVALTGLTVTSDIVGLSGSVALQDNTLDAALEGTLPDIGKFLSDASGTGTFDLSATGPLDALGFRANLDTQNAVLAGKTVERLSVTAEGSADRSAPSAEVTANGTLDGQTLQAAASLVSTPEGPQIPRLSLEAGPNRLTGALRLSPDFQPREGRVDFNFPDVSLLAALAGQTASGNLTGDAALNVVNGVTGLTAKASGSVASAGASLEGLALDLSMPDITSIAIDGVLSAARAGTPDAAIQNLRLDIAHSGNSTGFTLGGRYDNAPVALKGDLTQNAGVVTVRLDSFSAAPKQIPVRLAAPTTIRVENGTAFLDGLRIATGNGTVTVNGSAGSTLNVTAALAALPASLADTFVPGLAAEGAISGEVKASGAVSNPSVAYRLDWGSAATSQTRSAGLAPLSIRANGTFAGGRLGLDTAVDGGGGLTITGGGGVETAGNRALNLTFRGRVPMAALQAQLTQQGVTAEGAADVDVTIAGTAAAPLVTGTVTLNGAKVIDLRRNLTLDNLTGTVRFDGQQATITSLSGQLGGGGTVSASGTIGITPQSGFPADITVRLNRATYADGTLFTTSATGDLALRGPLLGDPVLSGRITLANTSITIPEKLPASLAEIDIRHRNAPPGVTAQMRDIGGSREAGGSSSTIGLDLVVNANSGIFVRGRGIDAELGGELTIRGTAVDPVVSGAFTMRRGRLTILARRLDFSSGTITFGGAMIPVLNLEATSTVNSTTITVGVTGLANDPAIVFSSSPALPQDEVIAQLIFGQSMSKLSPLQIAQLADAVSQLAGGRSSSLFESLRSNLGVDDLDISTDEKGDARVSAGKYLNERTYIQIEQSGSSGSKAIINLDVGRGVKLRGEAGADGSGAAGVFYEREY
ncbi:translocation/assembly module TamB [Rhizobiaceae bacterium BDR2-2]|uniref:Translocation/assembly module TamB n=1 Tax=Ectorhizobium quercum TaxID=2965071 RepID=A0AAE3SU74_9HYPH|nr:translocation/assembly module TamB domain-containing protein [Ectorhizobium quercum]MCX8996935.1 translocation/assembly module TamB [Ectorhizobium quercum]